MYRIGQEEIDAVAKVINAREFFRPTSPLHEVDQFETEWSNLIGSKYTLCLSGGTSSLVCALVGMGVGPGDEVIVPAYTFMASALAVLAVGAIPVIVDIDDSLTIDPVAVEKRISSHTKAIMPVHMCGFPADLDALKKIADPRGIMIIEDACQADGGSYHGKRLGTHGTAGAFSFNHYKILTCGEGGCVVTDERSVYERALIYHDGGTCFRPYARQLAEPMFCGVQYRTSELLGAILRVQTRRLDGILGDLRRVKGEMMSALGCARFIRSNDIAGDCGTTLGFAFGDSREARAFSSALLSNQVNAWLPIDSDKHVYCNWEPVLEKRGGHHPAIDPFKLPQNEGLQAEYSKDMCQKTLDILGRTVYISLNPDWTAQEVDRIVSVCVKSYRDVQ